MARDHHFFFAKKMIPTHTFQSTEKMFSELTGPKREAFVFFLWNEAGKASGEQLPHVAPDGGTLKKLEVIGRIEERGTEVVVISMPPAVQPNEAMFIALVRRQGQPSVFFYERCMGDGGAPVHPTEAVLSEVRPDGMRVNHGFKPGLDLAAFEQHLGEVLGISLAGLEGSLPEITMDAFRGAGARGGAGAGAGAGSGAKGSLLESLLLVRAALPLGFYVIGRTVPSLLGPVWQYVTLIYGALTLVIVILLWGWLYRVHAARREQASFSPAMSIVVWFIPLLNMFLIPLSLRSAHKAATGSGAGLLVLGWWLFYLVETTVMSLRSAGFHLAVVEGGYVLVIQNGGSVHVPEAVGSVLMNLTMAPGSLLIAAGAYGLLWYIVRSANARL